MSHSLRVLLAISAASSTLCFAAPARADCRGIWTKVCTGDGSGATDKPNVFLPAVNPAQEKLRADVKTYDHEMQLLFEGTRSIEPFLGLGWPANEQVLSRRIDGILSTVWPEYSATVLEFELLSSQRNFYKRRSDELRNIVAEQQKRLAVVRYDIPLHQRDTFEVETRLAGSREHAARLTSLALALINDQTSERRAIATVLAFSPRPTVSIARLAKPPPVLVLPGERSDPVLFKPASMVAREAAVPEPKAPEGYMTLVDFRPDPSAPLAEKLSSLRRISMGLYRANGLDFFRQKVPEDRESYQLLLAQRDELTNTLAPLEGEKLNLEQRFREANALLPTVSENQLNAGAAIVAEVVADMALDKLSSRMQGAVEEVVGIEDLPTRIPTGGSQDLFDLARRGGLALPLASHPRQWEAFIDAQEKTLDVLDRAPGFMTVAAHVAAEGTPEEIDAVIERIFGSVRQQTMDYVSIAGFDQLPEGEDRSTLQHAFVRVAEKLRGR